MTAWDLAARSINPVAALLVAIEIVTPGQNTIRLVNDTKNLTIGADTYNSGRFDVKLPNQDDKIPSARIVIDNIGRALIQFLDTIDYGRNSTLTVILVTDGGVVQSRETFKVMEVQISQEIISVGLGYEFGLDRKAVNLYYTPEENEGAFPG